MKDMLRWKSGEKRTFLKYQFKNFFVTAKLSINQPRDGPWPNPTQAYFWPTVNKGPTHLWSGYFLNQSDKINLTRRVKIKNLGFWGEIFHTQRDPTWVKKLDLDPSLNVHKNILYICYFDHAVCNFQVCFSHFCICISKWSINYNDGKKIFSRVIIGKKNK